MKRRIIQTEDGSNTIQIDELDETYHSRHGAIQEANHVFIEAGMKQLNNSQNSILEIGFGTGLNATLTAIEAQKSSKKINYIGIEAFPVEHDILQEMNYFSDETSNNLYEKIHETTWNEKHVISDYFSLIKEEIKLENIIYKPQFDLIYFDAFGFRAQPEMWDFELIKKCIQSLKPNGIFVTYSAKGQLKRDLKALGCDVEKIPGPPGKREMTRATLL